jgi:hypothetical protein
MGPPEVGWAAAGAALTAAPQAGQHFAPAGKTVLHCEQNTKFLLIQEAGIAARAAAQAGGQVRRAYGRARIPRKLCLTRGANVTHPCVAVLLLFRYERMTDEARAPHGSVSC